MFSLIECEHAEITNSQCSNTTTRKSESGEALKPQEMSGSGEPSYARRTRTVTYALKDFHLFLKCPKCWMKKYTNLLKNFAAPACEVTLDTRIVARDEICLRALINSYSKVIYLNLFKLLVYITAGSRLGGLRAVDSLICCKWSHALGPKFCISAQTQLLSFMVWISDEDTMAGPRRHTVYYVSNWPPALCRDTSFPHESRMNVENSIMQVRSCGLTDRQRLATPDFRNNE